VSDAAKPCKDARAVELSIIIVTHGARELTKACLKFLAPEAARINGEVIIVDNASPDGLAAEIASLYPHFHLLPQMTNIGFAAAANLGADVARGKHLLFLNPDTVTTDGALARLLEFAQDNPPGGIFGVRTVFADERLNPTCCRRKLTLWRLFCSALGLDTRFSHSALFSGMAYPDIPSHGEFAVDVVCGVCMLVTRTVWDRLSGFSPAFFMYGEDDDFCLRAARLGYTCKLLCEVAIVHHGSGTEPDQARKLCQILAARSLIIRSWFSAPRRPIGLVLLQLRPWLGQFFATRQRRPLWRSVWARHRRWISGRFA
jgi:N-acetylglucosaminyl-diphospho-decaprenol L-rhamnosyltransferase